MLEIPDTLYAALRQAVDTSGTAPLGWIAAHLPKTTGAEDMHKEDEAEPRTLADLFAGRVGRIRSDGEGRLSEGCGAKFTDYLEAKRGSECL